jgi:hypothetical protein
MLTLGRRTKAPLSSRSLCAPVSIPSWHSLLWLAGGAGTSSLFFLYDSLTLVARRKIYVRVILHAIFGETALRFGGMFGVFVCISAILPSSFALTEWRVTGRTLAMDCQRTETVQSRSERQRKGRILARSPSRRHLVARGPGRVERTQGWNRTTSLYPVSPKRQARCVSPLLTSRLMGLGEIDSGLQGVANLGSSRGLIKLPYGDIALFGLSCGQIVRCNFILPVSSQLTSTFSDVRLACMYQSGVFFSQKGLAT